MPSIKIVTRVNAALQTVKAGFDDQLFQKLNPPFPKARLLRYDGNTTGDTVVIELDFIIFKQQWTSKITANFDGLSQHYFIDEGTKLPFFLKSWRHKHSLESGKKGTYIVDDIEYTTPFKLTDWLMYPLLYGQFLYRKPIYKRYFK